MFGLYNLRTKVGKVGKVNLIAFCVNEILMKCTLYIIYRQSPVKSPDIKNVIVVTSTFLFEKVPHCVERT